MSNTEQLRAAAEQALEAMNYSGMDVGKFNRINAACRALREALSESTHPADVSKSGAQIDMGASGEPVAPYVLQMPALVMRHPERPESRHETLPVGMALYAAPQPAPARVPLTDEQIQAAWDSVDMRHPRGDATRNAFARVIEAAHGIAQGEPK